MKIIIAILAALMLTSGCGYHNLMGKIPNSAFKKFEYHRGGNFSSTHITAFDAMKIDNALVIDKLTLTSDYGPFVNFTIILEGYEVEGE